jgi:hypothetical protein
MGNGHFDGVCSTRQVCGKPEPRRAGRALTLRIFDLEKFFKETNTLFGETVWVGEHFPSRSGSIVKEQGGTFVFETNKQIGV